MYLFGLTLTLTLGEGGRREGEEREGEERKKKKKTANIPSTIQTSSVSVPVQSK